MVVIGDCILGLEMGSVWSRVSTPVTVVEFLGSIGGAGIEEKIVYVYIDSCTSAVWGH